MNFKLEKRKLVGKTSRNTPINTPLSNNKEKRKKLRKTMQLNKGTGVSGRKHWQKYLHYPAA